MTMSVNNVMGIIEEAEANGFLTINDSDELEKWLHDEQGFKYREEMAEAPDDRNG